MKRPLFSDSASQPQSYENLDVLDSATASDVELEMKSSSTRSRPKSFIDERTPLGMSQRHSMKRLVRQMSVMDTQKTYDGTMQLTHWI